MSLKYELLEIKPNCNTFEVYIKADSNDADYMYSLTSYTEEEFNQDIVDDLILLQSKYFGNHKLEYFVNDIYDKYERCTKLDIPYADLDCTKFCHTLEELRVTCIDTEGKAYVVKLNNLK